MCADIHMNLYKPSYFYIIDFPRQSQNDMAVVVKLIGLWLGLVYSFPVLLRLLYLLVKNPISFFRKKDRTEPPSCLTSDKWTHKYARLSVSTILNALHCFHSNAPVNVCRRPPCLGSTSNKTLNFSSHV